MIYSINIKNIALITEAQINFSDGFNVITGETGAGKSVLIGSINMLLGERISKEIISKGAKNAEVSAVFYVDDLSVRKYIEEEGISLDDSGELVMSRELYADGKNICRVNGRIVTVSTLKNIGRYLVDIHGQHNNQALLDCKSHIDILDKFAKDKLSKIYDEYKTTYEKMKDLKIKLDEIAEKSLEKERKIDILNYEINEIKSVNPILGEDEELKKKKEIIDNFKNLCALSNKAYNCLYENIDGKSAYEAVSESAASLCDAAKIDDNLKDIAESVEEIVVRIQESARSLSSYIGNLENGLDENFDIDARLDELYKLKRKYGGSLDSVIDHLEKCERELELINSSEELYNKVLSELNQTVQKAESIACELSKIRRETAEKIQKEICESLKFLNMADAKFEVAIEKAELSKNGFDKVEFMLTTIAGIPPRPLNKIASGGELSRIMLAIKSVLAETDSVKTMIFDEIDTGVSGIAAQKIGEKIKTLSKNKQIFCVTHLAQIASKADTHFVIEKVTDKQRTEAFVNILDKNGRIDEIARIISGDKVSPTTIKQAKEMLEF